MYPLWTFLFNLDGKLGISARVGPAGGRYPETPSLATRWVWQHGIQTLPAGRSGKDCTVTGTLAIRICLMH